MTDRFQVVRAAYVVRRRGEAVLLQLRRGTGYRDGSGRLVLDLLRGGEVPVILTQGFV